MLKNSQKGTSLFLAIMILYIVLAVIMGISSILVAQMKLIREMGYSVIAFYAADTGAERALGDIYQVCCDDLSGLPTDRYENVSLGDASYDTRIYCCTYDVINNPSCNSAVCPFSSLPPPEGLDCTGGTYFCIESTGTYKGVSRAVRVTF